MPLDILFTHSFFHPYNTYLLKFLLCVRNFVAVITIFVYLCYTFVLVQGYCVYQILMVVILNSNGCRCLSHTSWCLIEHRWSTLRVLMITKDTYFIGSLLVLPLKNSCILRRLYYISTYIFISIAVSLKRTCIPIALS